MVATVLLVRHATHDAVGRILCGRMPGIQLGKEGHAQAIRLSTYLARVSPDVLLTSPQQRCRETAAPIGISCGLEPVVSNAFDEIDFGAWTGLSFEKLAGNPAWKRWNTERGGCAPPGGESMRQAQARAVSGLTSLRETHPAGVIIAVSHADIIKSVLMWCLGLALDAYARFEIEPASISTVLLWDDGVKVLRMNESVP